jgi:hypothetical protein
LFAFFHKAASQSFKAGEPEYAHPLLFQPGLRVPSAAIGNGGVPHPVFVTSVYFEITHDATMPVAICASVHFVGIDGKVHGVEFVVSIEAFVEGVDPIALAVFGAVNIATTMTA